MGLSLPVACGGAWKAVIGLNEENAKMKHDFRVRWEMGRSERARGQEGRLR